MKKLTHCIKRDGGIVRFDKNRIHNAILKAFKSSNEGNKLISKKATTHVLEEINRVYKNETPTIEDIQDIVELTLMDLNFKKTAKHYILYREKRVREREKNV